MSNNLSLVTLVGPNHVDQLRQNIKNLPAVNVIIGNLTGQVLSHLPHHFQVVTPSNQEEWYDFKTNKVLDFSGARNWALAQIKTQWVLFLDADEIIDHAGWQKILSSVDDTQFTGYFLPRLDVFAGKTLVYGEPGDAKFLRLFQTTKGRWHSLVHEKVVIQGQAADLEAIITHRSHENISQFITQVSLFAQLEADQRRSSRSQILWQLLTYPGAKLIVNLLFKSAWRDGWQGVVYAYVMTLHSLCVRIYQWQKLNHRN